MWPAHLDNFQHLLPALSGCAFGRAAMRPCGMHSSRKGDLATQVHPLLLLVRPILSGQGPVQPAGSTAAAAAAAS